MNKPRFSVVAKALVLLPFFFSVQLLSAGEQEIREQALKAVPTYKAYFDSARKILKERDYVIGLAELALLAKEHLLLMGPPGNAKSMLADEILGNIVTDE